MHFNQLQEKIIKNAKSYGKRFKIEISQEFAILKLFEELGELAEAVLTHDQKSRPEKTLTPAKAKEKVAAELADVLGMTIVLANIFEIDLEKALQNKWIKE